MKYWEIVADKLSAAGKRYIVHSDGLLTAFLWLERTRHANGNAMTFSRISPTTLAALSSRVFIELVEFCKMLLTV